MHRIKIPQQDFALKMPGGGLCARGAYLRDTTVYTVYRVYITAVNVHLNGFNYLTEAIHAI